ncbi:MAG: Stp1/IreP family PP2C-type Ser/Thr phosphatase [Actinomycetota bacterium]|jgi:protein phosphatase
MAELRWGAATDKGRVREGNEDTFVAEPMVFAVADGMGGHQAGEVASALAASILRERLGQGAASESAASAAVAEANEAIFGAARANSDQSGMGTTVTALAILHAEEGGGEGTNEERLVLLNVGDSRTYRFRLGRLQRVTVDHSYVQELVATGHITDEEARTHPRRNIVTRALGIEPTVRSDVWSLPIVRGDRFVLCSDGLVDEVPDHEIADLVGSVEDPQMLAEVLVEMANRHGGRDNTTVVVVDVLAGAEPPDPTDELSFDPAWAEGVEEPAGWGDDNEPIGLTPVEPTTVMAAVVADVAATADVAVAAETPAAPKHRRRRLTIGTFAFVFALGLIGTITLTLVAVHARSGYFVGFDGDTVVVYQGQADKLLWFNPTVKAPSTKKRQDLDQTMIDVINSKPTFSSSEQAASFIANEVTPTTVATSTTTTTTTVPASSTTAVTVTSIAGP